MRRLMLRRIPLALLLCASLNLAMPWQQAMAHSPHHHSYQQAVPLKTVLNQVSSFYKVTILFEENLVKGKSTAFKFDPSTTTLDAALRELLTPLGLKASKIDNSNYAVVAAEVKKNDPPKDEVVVENPPVEDRVVPAGQVQQPSPVTNTASPGATSFVIRGRVVTDKDQPIPTASVMIKGTKTGTTTDAEGYFSFKSPEPRGTLLINHVSFAAREVIFDSRNNVNVRLTANVKEMETVIVSNGIFTRPKENFTGASVTITGDQLLAVNSVNVLDALKIFDPAIRIPDNVQFGSDPNRLPEITMRGTNNFPQQSTGGTSGASGADFMANYINNPNQPLFILDGFEVSLQRIYDLDVTRIATFTILKDASATAIYGSRAANGVIVVETKRPMAGSLRVSYSGNLQITGPDLSVYDLTNAAEKLEVERLAGLYSVYASGIRADADAVLRDLYARRRAAIERGVDFYWLSQPVRTGVGQRHSFYLEGGDNYIRYGINLGYSNNAGVMKNSNRDNYTGGVTISYNRRGMTFTNNLSVGYNKAVNSNYGSFGDYSRMNQYWNPYDSNGNYVKILETVPSPTNTSFTNYYNPLYNTTLNTVNQSQYTNINNQTNLNWLVGKGIRITGRFQVTKQHDESDVFLPAQHTSFATASDITRMGRYNKGAGKFTSLDGTLQVDYTKKMGRHSVLGSAGGSMSETKSDFLVVKVEGFPNDRLDEISFGNGYPPNTKPEFSSSITRLVGFFANLNYSYDNRYNADLSVRTDGSSQYGANRRFGTFWSAGASWNLHKEKFLRDKKYVSMARLRGSYGVTGDNKFPPYMSITSYQYYTDQNYRGLTGAILMAFGNKNLQWQQTIKRNVGVDLALLKNRISLSVDIYHENTTNLLLDINTPPSVGFGSYKENVGELENKGYEFRLNAFLVNKPAKGMFWSVFVNGLHNRDKIKAIANSLKKLNESNNTGDQSLPKLRFEEGQSVNTIWAVRSLGIDPSNGREVFVKKDGTLTYNWDAADKVVVGNTVPDMRGSFGTNFTWKGFTLGLYFAYEFGGSQYNQTLIDRVETTNFTYNVDRRVLLGRWKQPGDETFFKGLVDENGRTITTGTRATSRFVMDNNFINAESISLSYSFSEKLNKKLKLSNSRLSFATNDYLRWSSIVLERGLDYPFARTFTFSFSTTF